MTMRTRLLAVAAAMLFTGNASAIHLAEGDTVLLRFAFGHPAPAVHVTYTFTPLPDLLGHDLHFDEGTFGGGSAWFGHVGGLCIEHRDVTGEAVYYAYFTASWWLQSAPDVVYQPEVFFNPQSLPAINPVPGPIAGAGLPALLALGGFVWTRRRKAKSRGTSRVE
jgi:LPXTG-motif cell wall-anchored protein